MNCTGESALRRSWRSGMRRPPGRPKADDGPLGAEACGSLPACAGRDRRKRRRVLRRHVQGVHAVTTVGAREGLHHSRRARRGFCGMSRKAQNPRQAWPACLVLQRSGSPAKPRPRRGSAQNGPFAHQTACVCLGHTTRGVGGQIIPFWTRTRMAGAMQTFPRHFSAASHAVRAPSAPQSGDPAQEKPRARGRRSSHPRWGIPR